MADDDEGLYELREDGDPAELRGPADGSGWKGPKPGDPDFVPPKVVVERVGVKEDEGERLAAGQSLELTPEQVAEAEDIHKNKAMAILAYVCFLIPLVAAPTSKFARFHANQGLLSFILWIVAVVAVVVLALLRWGLDYFPERLHVLAWFFGCGMFLLQPLLLIGALAMMVAGIVHAANGEMKGLPVVGAWRLIK